MSLARPGAIAGALLLIATAAVADAPPPRHSVDLERFTGRWYEIARTPNRNQPDCTRLAIDITPAASGRYAVVNTCSRAGRGPQVVRASAEVADTRTNAKLRFRAQSGAAGMLGVTQEFWVLDRAADYSWAIIGTPGGNYFWLWTRQADPANRDALMARVRALGYDTDRAVRIGG